MAFRDLFRGLLGRTTASVAGAVASIAGAPTVGQTLTASATNLTGVVYQWLRDGTAISGATGSTYTTVTADVGRTVSVRATGSVTSAGVVVAPVAAVVTPTPTPTASNGITTASASPFTNAAGSAFSL